MPAHQLQGELAIPVPRYRHRSATITAGKGWGICWFTPSQACSDRPHTTRHARICNGAPVLDERVFITNVKGTFLGMSESEEASKRR